MLLCYLLCSRQSDSGPNNSVRLGANTLHVYMVLATVQCVRLCGRRLSSSVNMRRRRRRRRRMPTGAIRVFECAGSDCCSSTGKEKSIKSV